MKRPRKASKPILSPIISVVAHARSKSRVFSQQSLQIHVFFVPTLGHFLLTHLLLPKLKAAEQGRVINVSARAHLGSDIHLDDLNLEKNFSVLEAFGQSKLALILMARHMSHILKGKLSPILVVLCFSSSLNTSLSTNSSPLRSQDTNVTVNAVNPGRVRGTQHMRRSPLSSTYVIKLSMQPWMWLLLKSPVQGAQTSVYSAVASQLDKCSGKYFR